MHDEGMRGNGKRNGGNGGNGARINGGGKRISANQDLRKSAKQLALVCRAKLGRVTNSLEKAIFAWLVLGDTADDVRACCDEAASEPTAKTPTQRYTLMRELVRMRRKSRTSPKQRSRS